MTFIQSVCAKFALSTYTRYPLYARPVPDLPEVLHVGADGDNGARAFVPGDAACAFGHFEGPFILEEGFVGRAETGVVYFYEDLVRGGLGHGDFLDGDCGALARALFDGCFLGLGKVHCRQFR
jgi:hypothetical protein